MPLLKRKLQADAEEKQRINKRVSSEPFRPTAAEAEQIRAISAEIADEFRDEISEHGFTQQIKEQIRATKAKKADALDLGYESQKRIEVLTASNITGLGPIEPYIEDDTVTEIIVQRYDNICIERAGLIYWVDAAFLSEAHLRNVIGKIVQPIGRQINLYTPMVDARLHDGARVNATIPPASPDGATLTIRKFPEDIMTGQDYIAAQSLNEKMLTFLSLCVRGRVNLIVSGGTTTGKTTLLNMLATYIPDNELIVSIEDSCELKLPQRNVRRLEARMINTEGMMPVTIQSLVRNALRMRPDRLIVGEIRDGTVVDMMSAMSTGHPGSMSTVHANSPQNLVSARLPILYSMHTSVAFSEEAQRLQIAEALQLIVQVDKLKNGQRKIISITHVAGLDNNKNVMLREIFRYNRSTDKFEATGYVPQRVLEQIQGAKLTVDMRLFRCEEGGKQAHE